MADDISDIFVGKRKRCFRLNGKWDKKIKKSSENRKYKLIISVELINNLLRGDMGDEVFMRGSCLTFWKDFDEKAKGFVKFANDNSISIYAVMPNQKF